MTKIVVNTEQISEALLDATASSRYLRKEVERTIDHGAELWKVVWETTIEGVKAKETGTPHPYETGEYVEHIKTEKLKLRDKLFIKNALKRDAIAGSIYNDSEHAVFIEEGTKPDKPGGHSPWGPDTPTPAFRIAERTAELMKEGITGK